jgi:hypothetical protein
MAIHAILFPIKKREPYDNFVSPTILFIFEDKSLPHPTCLLKKDKHAQVPSTASPGEIHRVLTHKRNAVGHNLLVYEDHIQCNEAL